MCAYHLLMSYYHLSPHQTPYELFIEQPWKAENVRQIQVLLEKQGNLSYQQLIKVAKIATRHNLMGLVIAAINHLRQHDQNANTDYFDQTVCECLFESYVGRNAMMAEILLTECKGSDKINKILQKENRFTVEFVFFLRCTKIGIPFEFEFEKCEKWGTINLIVKGIYQNDISLLRKLKDLGADFKTHKMYYLNSAKQYSSIEIYNFIAEQVKMK